MKTLVIASLTFVVCAVVCSSALAQDPIPISNIYELQEIGRSLPLDGNYILSQDIDASETNGGMDWASGGFEPIGNPQNRFTGIFEGAGHVITGLTIDRPYEDSIGLFGTIGKGGEVRNVTLQNVNVRGGLCTGALVGELSGGRISGCSVYGSVSGGPIFVGGLVGCSRWSTVTSSSCSVTLQADAVTGGLVGSNYYATISQCTASGLVTGSWYTGGLTGYSDGGLVEDCTANATVTGTESVGGLAGASDGGGGISSCRATGSVSGTDYIGGLVGSAWICAITDSSSTGTVEGSTGVGGLLGFNDLGKVQRSYSEAGTSGLANVGGLVGVNSGDISTSYATGTVLSVENSGGLVGVNSGVVRDSYAIASVTSELRGAGLIALAEKGGVFNTDFRGGRGAVGGLAQEARKAPEFRPIRDSISSASYIL